MPDRWGKSGSNYILDPLRAGLSDVECYEAQDLAIGSILNIYGKRVLLTDCDEFTKSYYIAKYGLSQLVLYFLNYFVLYLMCLGFFMVQPILNHLKNLASYQDHVVLIRQNENCHHGMDMDHMKILRSIVLVLSLNHLLKILKSSCCLIGNLFISVSCYKPKS